MKNARKNGTSVAIITQVFVDEKGKEVPFGTEGGRLVLLKRPRIVYTRNKNLAD